MEVMKDFNLREHIITGNIYVIYYRKWLTNKANLLIIFQFSSSLAITRVYTLAIWTQKMMIVYIIYNHWLLFNSIKSHRLRGLSTFKGS